MTATSDSPTETAKWRARWKRERAARVEAERIADAATADALLDPLTGLANRTLLVDRINIALDQSRRDLQPLSLLFVDLDRFKRINDSSGHDVGDEVLCEVTHRLRSTVRSTDTVARFGGDEFAILLYPITDEQAARGLCERILDAISMPVRIRDGREFYMSASVGYVLAEPDDGSTACQLLRDADTAMYQSKEAGRARVLPFDGALRRREAERLQIESELGRALGRAEFLLHFQTIVPLAADGPHSTEALVRWNHPTRGLVPPGEFIDIAEESGLIVPLGRWIMHEACRTHATWMERAGLSERCDTGPGRRGSFVSINVSPIQLESTTFADSIVRTLDETGVDPHDVCFEVTESSLLSDGPAAIANLQQIERLGCKLAIDDFGTGYSSLSYLRRFDVDILKIDQGFTNDVGDDPAAAALVEAINAMAHALGITTIAEGVETAEQAEILTALGCDFAQGYHFARPVAADEVGRERGRGCAEATATR